MAGLARCVSGCSGKAGDGLGDARILAAVDQAGSISLMGWPGIHAPGQLRQGAVAVDARESGLAFLLYGLLRSQALAPGTDYRVAETGLVLAARSEYLDQAPDTAARFAAAFRQAVNYCRAPARHADCTGKIVRERQVSPDGAARMVDVAVDARAGLVPDALIPRAQLEGVVELRRRWGGFSADAGVAGGQGRPRGLIGERLASTG